MFRPICAVAAVDGEPPVLFVGRECGTLEKFSNANETDQAPSLCLSGHVGAITVICTVSADDVFTASVDGTVRQWNTATDVEGKREQRCVKLPCPVRALALSGELLYAGGQDGHVYAVVGNDVNAWKGHREAVSCIALTEGLVCSGSHDNQLRVWDLTGRCLHVLLGHENGVKFAQWVSPGAILSVASDESLRLWFIPEGSSIEASSPQSVDATDGGVEVPGQRALSGGGLIRSVAVVRFSGVPLGATANGPMTLVGTATGELIGIQVKEFLGTVQDFQARNRSIVRDEKLRVERQRVERANKLRTRLRKSLQGKRKELKEAEKAVAAAALAEKQRLARERAMENDEDEPPAEELPGEEDAAEDTPLTPEHEEALTVFTQAQEAATQAAIEEGKAAATRRIAEVAPIASLVYTTEPSSFFRLPFTRHFKASSSCVGAVTTAAKTAFVPSNDAIRRIAVVAGITAV